jgi:hypothetical protein
LHWQAGSQVSAAAPLCDEGVDEPASLLEQEAVEIEKGNSRRGNEIEIEPEDQSAPFEE